MRLLWLSTAVTFLAWPMAFLGDVHGQAVTIQHTFGNGVVPGDGQVPLSALVQGSDGNFYGTAQTGGTANQGCIFKCTPSGTVTILHSFGDGSVDSDGANPATGLLLASDGNFYGTTFAGGSSGSGCVFELTSAGTYSVLHRFSGLTSDAAGPHSGLIQGIDGNFYGTAFNGGSAAEGCVYEITHGGTVTLLHSFNDGSVSNDGVNPGVGLVQDAQGNFYGTTYLGGANNDGTVFLINAQRRYSILYHFSSVATISFSSDAQILSGGSGGYFPNSRLLLGINGNLYGTTFASSSAYGNGAVYEITPQGQETVLSYFGYGAIVPNGQTLPSTTNTEAPGENQLIQTPDGNIYGTTTVDGSASKGSLFKLTPEGRVTILHSFLDGTVPNDGSAPSAGVMLGTDGNFYGTASAGGTTGLGVVFKVNPQLPAITSNVTINGAVGVAVAYQAVATNSPTSYSATNLPAGLAIDSSTGLISGTPTNLGKTTGLITATNASGANSVPLTVIISPPPIITSILAAFPAEQYYLYQITASGNPTSFSATGLPPGLAVNPTTGLISGAPTSTGTFSATIQAFNVAGSDSRTLKFVVSTNPPSTSQEYVLIHSSTDGTIANEGSSPRAVTAGTDGTLYGVTTTGGANNSGTIFNLSPAGKGSVLSALGGTNGSIPQGVVQGADGNLYGTTQNGGAYGKGAIFKMTPGGVITLLHTFGDETIVNDGANPRGGLIQATDGNLYGTTQSGGSAGQGVVFKVTPQAVLTILHSFAGGSVANDGKGPLGGVIQASDGNFYGTTQNGGSSSDGTVFEMNPAGTVTIIHNFIAAVGVADGGFPVAGLIQDSPGRLEGTTPLGGSAGKGIIFQMDTSGHETILHTFGDGSVTNDGANPQGPLVTFDGFLFFGTTQNGGAAGEGTVFEFTIFNLNYLTIVHSFGDGSIANDGANPLSGLCLGTDGNLYGTTSAGGSAGAGTVYAFAGQFSLSQFEVFTATYWTLTGTLPAGMTFDSTSGTISGTPLPGDPPGAYQVTITQVSNTGTTVAGQNVTINLSGVANTKDFPTWEAQYLSATLLANTAISGPAAVAKSDEVPNLLKYVYNIGPALTMTVADRSALPIFNTENISGTDYLTLTYRRYALLNAITTQVSVQTSHDLVNWHTVTPDLTVPMGTDPNTGDPILKVGVQMGAGRQFIRLNVASP